MENNKLVLNIDSKKKINLIPKLDNSDFFRLSNNNCYRKDLFNFGLALGYKRGYPTKLDKRESFIRAEGLDNDKFLYNSVFFKEKIDGNPEKIDKITDNTLIFDTIENYVNTGLDIIAEYMRDMTEENMMFKLIQEIDEAYKDFHEDFPN